MPRYDYRCEAGHKYEKIESFGAPAVQPCQRCGKEARRLLVPPQVLFKGPGFYATSTRDAKPQREGRSTAASSSSNGSGTKSEPAGGEKRTEQVQAAD